jgi:protein SCO1/2
MKPFRRLFAVLIACLALGSSIAHAQTATTTPAQLPGNSVYQLSPVMTDQDGRHFTLAEKRGKPVLVSMFYNSCQFVCPMLIDTLRDTEAALKPEERKGLSVLLVTFDPARDDVATLKDLATKRNLDLAHWTLARTDAASVRKLAAVLGIQYRRLPNGDYNHTTALILLDAEGRIAGSTSKLGAVDADFVKLIKEQSQP